jgi:hypothetical protein
MLELIGPFTVHFLLALRVNLSIAFLALLAGLVAGGVLMAAHLRPGWSERIARAALTLMRAAPTFVLMFFLLNTLPRNESPAWVNWTPFLSVVLSLAVFAAAYVCDNALECLRQWRAGSRVAVWLFLMGLVRAFFVMVLSSGFGAAVGVVEATTVTLRALEQLKSPGDRIVLMVAAVSIFMVIFQLIYWAINRVRQHITLKMATPKSGS